MLICPCKENTANPMWNPDNYDYNVDSSLFKRQKNMNYFQILGIYQNVFSIDL